MSKPKELTCVEYVALVAGSLINFAERTAMTDTRTAAAWKKEFRSYLNSQRTRTR